MPARPSAPANPAHAGWSSAVGDARVLAYGSGCAVGQEGGTALAEGLRHTPCVETLDLA